MDISRNLPDPLPEGWIEVDRELRALMEKYGTQLVLDCSVSILDEKEDTLIVGALKPLLERYSGVNRILVSYKPYVESEAGFFVFVETDQGYAEELLVHDALRDIVRDLCDEIGDSQVFVDSSMEEFLSSIGDRPYKVIDRTTE